MVDYETAENGQKHAVLHLVFRNITAHTLKDSYIQFGLFLFDDQGNRHTAKFFWIAEPEDESEITPGETLTHNGRFDVTQVYDHIVHVTWGFYINATHTRTRDVRLEDDKDELSPVPIVLLSEEGGFSITDTGEVFAVGNGVILNNSGMAINNLNFTLVWKDETGEDVDYVIAPVLTSDGDGTLPVKSKGVFSYRHRATDWYDRLHSSDILFFAEGTYLRHVDRSD